MNIIEQLAAVVEAARAEKCRDSVRGDTCGACGYCLAWALTDDWEQQLQALERTWSRRCANVIAKAEADVKAAEQERDSLRDDFADLEPQWREAHKESANLRARVAVLTWALGDVLEHLPVDGTPYDGMSSDLMTCREIIDAALTPKAEA